MFFMDSVLNIVRFEQLALNNILQWTGFWIQVVLNERKKCKFCYMVVFNVTFFFVFFLIHVGTNCDLNKST